MKTRSWDDLVKFYRGLVEDGWQLNPIVELIQHIKTQNYSNHIFGATSVHYLIISIYEEIELNREMIKIGVESNSQYRIQYFSKPFMEATIVMEVQQSELKEKFDNIIRNLRW